jgi:uncharacterized membrane protein
MKNGFKLWQGNFLAGLALILPALISLWLFKVIFGTVSNFTDVLLIFLPAHWTHSQNGNGPVHWYYSLAALVLALLFVSLLGSLARHYIGEKLIEWLDALLLRVPLINKIYGTVKQVQEAFAGNKSAFKQVVLIQYPRAGVYSVGFVTNDENPDLEPKTGRRVVSVFIPTTPNPTSGFLVLVPETEVTKLEMSVADGIKFIISLGAVSPDSNPRPLVVPVSPAAGRG